VRFATPGYRLESLRDRGEYAEGPFIGIDPNPDADADAEPDADPDADPDAELAHSSHSLQRERFRGGDVFIA
jgi:hypothetical protein